MGETIIEKLIISIGVDAKEVGKDIQNVVKNAKDKLKDLLSTEIPPQIASVLGLVAVAIGNFVKNTYQEIISLDKLSERLGTTVDQLQMWQEATKDAGVSATEIGKVWEHLNTQIFEATTKGRGALANLVKQGILPDLQTADGQIKDTEKYLLELADAFSKMDTKTAMTVGKKIGIGDSELMEFLREGSGSINQKLDHIKQLGIYTKEDVKIAKDFDKALKELKASFNDVGRQLKSMLMPAYRLLIPIMTEVAKAVREFTKHIRILYPAIALVGAIILKSLIPAIKGIGTALGALIMKHPYLLAVAAVLTLIGLLFEDFMVYLEGGQSVIGEFLAEFDGFGDAVRNGVMAALTAFTEFIEGVQNKLRPLLDYFSELPDRIGEGAKQAAERFRQWFAEPIGKLIDIILTKLGNLFNIGGRVSELSASASNIPRQGGNIDNSQHSANTNNTLTFNGYSAADAKRIASGYTNPTPAVDDSYI